MKLYKIMINVKSWTSKLNFGDFAYSVLMLHFFIYFYFVWGNYSWTFYLFLSFYVMAIKYIIILAFIWLCLWATRYNIYIDILICIYHHVLSTTSPICILWSHLHPPTHAHTLPCSKVALATHTDSQEEFKDKSRKW